uniref:NADH dehydrogenase subunit 6 n=1 Tax=Rhabdopleura compacta TaxID=638968 RepID=F8J475_RHACM|nr:NADH dehydrogenase subunit 6 [Rhabdopleura compacta]
MSLGFVNNEFYLGVFFSIYIFGSLFACVCASPYVVVFGVLLSVLGVLGVIFLGGVFFTGLLFFLVYLGGMMVVFSYSVSLSADRFFLGTSSVLFVFLLGILEVFGIWVCSSGFLGFNELVLPSNSLPTSYELLVRHLGVYVVFGLFILFLALLNCFYFIGGVSGRKSIFAL